MAEAPYADNEKTVGQTHRVHIRNLKPGTTYFFYVDSGQGEGTGTEAKSGVAQFTTKQQPGRHFYLLLFGRSGSRRKHKGAPIV
ncbi:MAG TPA: fibronectin type III domain-containing protein [Candidatus Acidoferrales bacterium]|nr:fibronectin type III domain-containing protein [Candidatus Acidoferrales bacterium]